jgi:hypothetical protein
MKEYRVSLDVVTALAVTDSELAELLGVSPSALVREQERGHNRWRYEPSTAQTGGLADRLGQLASEIRPSRALDSRHGIREVSLAIGVRYDTPACMVFLPLHRLVYGPNAVGTSIPELNSIELTCTASDENIAPSDQGGRPPRDPDPTVEELQKLCEEWEAAGRPEGPRARSPLVMDTGWRPLGGRGSTRRASTDRNEYIVSLDAFTSAWATRSEVADLLGLPPAAFYRQRIEGGLAWTCEVEADETVGLAERIGFLASAVHPRRPRPRFRRNAKIRCVYLDIGVICDVSKTKACSVRLPLACLRSLVGKLLVHYVRVACWPGTGGGGNEKGADRADAGRRRREKPRPSLCCGAGYRLRP